MNKWLILYCKYTAFWLIQWSQSKEKTYLSNMAVVFSSMATMSIIFVYLMLLLIKPPVYSPVLNVLSDTQRDRQPTSDVPSGLLTHRTKAGPVILSLEPTAAKALFLFDLKPELHNHLYGQFNLTVL